MKKLAICLLALLLASPSFGQFGHDKNVNVNTASGGVGLHWDAVNGRVGFWDASPTYSFQFGSETDSLATPNPRLMVYGWRNDDQGRYVGAYVNASGNGFIISEQNLFLQSVGAYNVNIGRSNEIIVDDGSDVEISVPVGIGSASPEEELEVDGEIAIVEDAGGNRWRLRIDAATKKLCFDYTSRFDDSYTIRASIDTTGAYTDE
jgi:hypothetical protein